MYKRIPLALLECARSNRSPTFGLASAFCRHNFSTSASTFAVAVRDSPMEGSSDAAGEAAPNIAVKNAVNQDYTKWSHSALVERVLELEKSMASYAQAQTRSNTGTEPAKPKKPSGKKPKASFDFPRYSTRLIALKFAYFGAPYQGFEYHGNETLLPTVEEKLFEAFLKGRLVQPRENVSVGPNGEEIIEKEPVYKAGGISESSDNIEGGLRRWLDLDKWQYTKCGRTDKGVSAFSQVVGIRVVSNRPKTPEASEDAVQEECKDTLATGGQEETSPEATSVKKPAKPSRPWDDINDEFDYISKLNTLLPSSIRVLAWCPHPPPDFSARFNCKGRTYHYYFTNPVFPPGLDECSNRLDIEKMREGAKYFEGLHDFRNFCKLDPTKQITNFMRRIFSSTIEKVELVSPHYSFISGTQAPAAAGQPVPELYYFRLSGTAFLWNQVRHMIAVLFLIGQGLEKPDVIPRLLEVADVTGRPRYELADDRPLVLWDCDFDKEELKWVSPEIRMKKHRPSDLLGSAWGAWHEANMDATLAGGLMSKIHEQANNEDGRYTFQQLPQGKKKKVDNSQAYFDGSPFAKSGGKYIPLLERQRLEPVEIMNEKFAQKKGEEWKKKWGADARRTRREIDGEFSDDGSE